jgi:uncharacterized membrane protein
MTSDRFDPRGSRVPFARTRRRPRRIRRSIEIAASPESVYDLWSRYEEFPRWTDAVRRTKRVDGHVLWDVELAGRQLVWDAQIVEAIAGKIVRWRSVGGAPHAGEVRFAAIGPERTRVTVTLDVLPTGWLERIGVRLGVLGAALECELGRLAGAIERAAREAPAEEPRAGRRRVAGSRR